VIIISSLLKIYKKLKKNKYTEELHDIPLYVLPIKPIFLFNAEANFNQLVIDYVAQFHTNNNGKEREKH